MPECNHHVKGTHKDCADIKQVDPKCSKTCQNGANQGEDKHKSSNRQYSIPLNFEDMKHELVTNGPFTGAFTV